MTPLLLPGPLQPPSSRAPAASGMWDQRAGPQGEPVRQRRSWTTGATSVKATTDLAPRRHPTPAGRAAGAAPARRRRGSGVPDLS